MRGEGRFRVRIGTLLVLGFGSLVFVAVAGVLILGLSSARQNTQELLAEKTISIVDLIERQIHNHLRPVELQARSIAGDFATGRVGLADAPALELLLRGALATTPQVTGIGFIDTDLRLRRYRRGFGWLPKLNEASAQPLQPVLDAARAASAPRWAELVRPPELDATAINLRTPLRRDGQLLGVMVHVVTVGDLSGALSKVTTDERMTPFILYDRQWVLAHPLIIDMPQTLTESVPLPRLEDIGDAVMALVWSEDGFPAELAQPADQTEVQIVPEGDIEYAFLHRTLNRYGDAPWTVGAYFDAAVEEGRIQRLQLTLFGGLAVLALSLVSAVVIGRLTGRPIRRLAVAAQGVQQGHLDAVEPLPPSRLRELDDASHAFNGMVDGLKERETIRSLFGRYVPETVAAALLHEKGDLEPQTVEATVLFVDLEGFTALAESMSPHEVIDMLNAYFSALVEILESHGGVVTQFQGDAILATFNVPAPDPDHAAQAVAAALRMVDTLRQRRFLGHRLACRVGINSGTLTAGAVGAADRLNYTVHGDAVNLAARLESMNKQYGTRILLTETTAALAGPVPNAVLRPMGTVDIRGKSEAVTLLAVESSTPATE